MTSENLSSSSGTFGQSSSPGSSPEAGSVHLERRLTARAGALWALAVGLMVVAVPWIHARTAVSALEERGRSLAAAVGHLLSTPDPTDRGARTEILPGLRTALVDPDVVMVEALADDGGRLGVATPRSAVEPAERPAPAPADGALVVEESTLGGGPVASVRITLSQANVDSAVRTVWYRSVLGGLLLLPLGLAMGALLVRGGFAPLRGVAPEHMPPVTGPVGELLTGLRRRVDQAEASVASTEAIAERILAHGPDATVLFDAGGRCVWSSSVPLPGVAQAPVRAGATVREAWGSAGTYEDAWASKAYDRCLREETVVEHEVEIPVAQGSSRHAWTRWVPVPDLEGGTGVLLFARDVTTQVRNRARLEDQAQRLRQAERLEAVGRLAGSVAHDFNNLLTVIRGFCDLMSMGLPPDSDQADDLEEIRVATHRGSALTRRLLGFARKTDDDSPELLDPAEAVRRVQGMVSRILGESTEVVVEAEDGVDSIRIDPVRLEQMLLNLASNARDAMPGGGTFSIGVSATRQGKRAEGRGPELLARAVVLSVSDTGTGMDEVTASRIFNPFFTTKEEGKGTGLGLATVQEIIKEAGGFIEVESTPGVGTTFHLHLPAATEETGGEDAAATDVRGPTTTAHGERILVVDDDTQLVRLMRRVLVDRGYRVFATTDPARAPELARESSPLDLVVTDVAMRGLSGPELVNRLRQEAPEIKVLFTSGHSDEALLSYGIDASNDSFLAKPFSPEALAWRVRTFLGNGPER